jgi:hypothetical protein
LVELDREPAHLQLGHERLLVPARHRRALAVLHLGPLGVARVLVGLPEVELAAGVIGVLGEVLLEEPGVAQVLLLLGQTVGFGPFARVVR